MGISISPTKSETFGRGSFRARKVQAPCLGPFFGPAQARGAAALAFAAPDRDGSAEGPGSSPLRGAAHGGRAAAQSAESGGTCEAEGDLGVGERRRLGGRLGKCVFAFLVLLVSKRAPKKACCVCVCVMLPFFLSHSPRRDPFARAAEH